MNDKAVKMGMGLVLFGLGVWALVAGSGPSPVTMLPDGLKLLAAILSIGFGYWLYKSSCTT
jgi:hypothetical protein